MNGLRGIRLDCNFAGAENRRAHGQKTTTLMSNTNDPYVLRSAASLDKYFGYVRLCYKALQI